jgi:hypothetical protein
MILWTIRLLDKDRKKERKKWRKKTHLVGQLVVECAAKGQHGVRRVLRAGDVAHQRRWRRRKLKIRRREPVDLFFKKKS